MCAGWRLWWRAAAVCAALGVAGAGQVAAQGLPPNSGLITPAMVDQIKRLTQHPIFAIALQVNNSRHDGLTAAQIQELDAQWLREAEAGGETLLVAAVMSNALSNYAMRFLGSSLGLYSEFVVADRQGLTAGTSHMMHDYFQADEEWFTAAIVLEKGQTWWSDLEFHEATGTWRKQISFPVMAEGGSTALGVARIEVNMTELNRRSAL